MEITAILTDPGKGGTFLTWSLHYLAGHDQYYFAKDKQWTDLINNPVAAVNAHNFKPNQPVKLDDFHMIIRNFKLCDKDTAFHTLYFHNFFEGPYQFEFSETKQAVKLTNDLSKKIITVTNRDKNDLYEKSNRSRNLVSSLRNPAVLNQSDQEQFEDYVEFYFQNDLKVWNQLSLTKVWDQREFLALNNSQHTISIAPCLNLSQPHYSIDFMELVNTADSLIEDLFDFLQISIDLDRLENWQRVYQAWRKIHYQRLNFVWCFDKIIEYILKGYYMDLQRFNLDLYQEAIIQHELIYKHNLNFKTWQLEKFTDTLQLHRLLETNTHQLQHQTQLVRQHKDSV